MSVTLMGDVFKISLEPGLKLLLLALADRADDDGGSCHPGQKYLSEKCSMSERTVRRHLVELEDRGFIHRRARFRGEGRGRTSDSYFINVQAVKLSAGQVDHRSDDARLSGQIEHDQPDTGVQGYIRDTSENHQSFAHSADEDFETFWKAYPRSRNRKSALRAWGDALKKADATEILTALQAQRDEMLRDKRYIPFPAKWLDREQWLDDVDSPTGEYVEEGW